MCLTGEKRSTVTIEKEQVYVAAIAGGLGGVKVQGLILVFYY
jgi:hypothetical protein